MAKPSINLSFLTTVAIAVCSVVDSRSTSSRQRVIHGSRGRSIQESHLTESLRVDNSQLRRHERSDRQLKMNKARKEIDMKEGSKGGKKGNSMGGKKGNSMGGKKGYSMGGKKENSKGGMKVLEKKVMEGRPVEVAESYFDLSNCSSYSTPWLFDLAASCSDEVTFADCECPTAGTLLKAGVLKCADSLTSSYACPEECEVCQVCLIVIGCKNIYMV